MFNLSIYFTATNSLIGSYINVDNSTRSGEARKRACEDNYIYTTCKRYKTFGKVSAR